MGIYGLTYSLYHPGGGRIRHNMPHFRLRMNVLTMIACSVFNFHIYILDTTR